MFRFIFSWVIYIFLKFILKTFKRFQKLTSAWVNYISKWFTCLLSFSRYKYHLYFTSLLHTEIKLKSFLMEDKNLTILQSQYHGCWCHGETGHLAAMDGTDLFHPKYSRFRISRVKAEMTLRGFDYYHKGLHLSNQWQKRSNKIWKYSRSVYGTKLMFRMSQNHLSGIWK